MDLQILIQTFLQKIEQLEARIKVLKAENALLKNKKNSRFACGEKYVVIVVNEQTAYQTPGNSHSSRQASAELIRGAYRR